MKPSHNVRTKSHGQVYTPNFIVKMILDQVGYRDDIINKHVIDNSCGDGAFLVEIVDRICKVISNNSNDSKILKYQLETFVHGIDNDEKAINNCRRSLNEAISKYNLEDLNWDIRTEDTLTCSDYDGKMDFVVGNPPYVRVHNLKETYSKVKQYAFAGKGMTDLYIVFFEIGFRMLKKDGRMGLITPSSYLRSGAGSILRKFIAKNRNISQVIDLEHFQAFEATTYTIISIFNNSKINNEVDYFVIDGEKRKPQFIERLDFSKAFINKKFYFSSSDDLNWLWDIEEKYQSRTTSDIVVKNGFATLADQVFIGDFSFSNYLIDVLKASTGKWYKAIFPYNNQGYPINIEQLKEDSELFTYLLENRKLLMRRDAEDSNSWFLYGRTQAIKDVFVDKIAINTTLRDIKSIKLEFVPSGKGLYSGLYIISKYNINEIREVIQNNSFIRYLRLLKNYKSGGYYSFSSKELEKYLYYQLNGGTYEQRGLFTNYC